MLGTQEPRWNLVDLNVRVPGQHRESPLTSGPWDNRLFTNITVCTLLIMSLVLC